MASPGLIGDPFRKYLLALLSFYELYPQGQDTPIPRYHGPSDWETDAILRSLSKLAERLPRAEDPAPSPPKAAPPPPPPPSSLEDGKGASIAAPTTSKTRDNPLASLDFSWPDFSQRNVNSFGVPINLAETASAPATAFAEHIDCPTCGTRVTDPSIANKVASLDAQVSPHSLSIISGSSRSDKGGHDGGLNAQDELKLLKDQVQDVARVCNAVANGDLSQKITVEVRSIVMVKLKDAINTMVRQGALNPHVDAYPS